MQADADEPRQTSGQSAAGGVQAADPPLELRPAQPSLIPGLPMPGLPDSAALDADAGEDGLAPEELDALLQAEPTQTGSIHPGSRCAGRIVTVDESGVIVSFGAKVEGHVALEEFRDASGEIVAEPGQQIEVIVERLGAPGSYAVLSYRRARELTAWKQIESSYAQRLPIQGRVVGRVKGGLRVDIGVAAFLPGSQLDIRPVRDLDAWLGKTIEVLVVECNRRRSNAVVSRSELLKAELQIRQQETLSRCAWARPLPASSERHDLRRFRGPRRD